MKESCGNCNFKERTIADNQGVRHLCLYDSTWHNELYKCNHWRSYINDMTIDTRVKMATDLKSQELKDKEKKWWHDPLLVAIVSSIISAIVTGTISWRIAVYILNSQKTELNQVQLILEDKNKEITELKEEVQNYKDRMPKIPITVIDPATGNQLYIGKPIPRPTYYEFPITLNDGQGSYRIDQYKWFNGFEGVLIIQKSKADSSNK